MQEVLCANYYNIHKNEQKRFIIQTRSQVRASGTILLKVHGVDKGVDPNVQSEKQIIRPVVTPQSHASTQSKDQFYVKPRLGQGRTGIKKNLIRVPIPQSQDRPEQLK